MKARVLTERTRKEMLELQKEFDRIQTKYDVLVVAVANEDDDIHSGYACIFSESGSNVKVLDTCNGINAIELKANFYKTYIELVEKGK